MVQKTYFLIFCGKRYVIGSRFYPARVASKIPVATLNQSTIILNTMPKRTTSADYNFTSQADVTVLCK